MKTKTFKTCTACQDTYTAESTASEMYANLPVCSNWCATQFITVEYAAKKQGKTVAELLAATKAILETN